MNGVENISNKNEADEQNSKSTDESATEYNFLIERGQIPPKKKELSSILSRGERIELELQEMRANSYISSIQDENENEIDYSNINKDTATRYVSDYCLEEEVNQTRLSHISSLKNDNANDNRSQSQQPVRADGFVKPFRELKPALNQIKELLSHETNYNSQITIERKCDGGRQHPYLHRGSLSNVLNGLTSYYAPAASEQGFITYQIQIGENSLTGNEFIRVFEFIANYQTHIDIAEIYKIGIDDYLVWGILPPYEGTLIRYKKYFDLIPRKLYHS